MGGTRIMVLKLKEIIKYALFVVVGLILIFLLIRLIFPKDKINNEEVLKFTPGTYNASVSLKNGSAEVSVTVSDDMIQEIKLLNMMDNQDYVYPLLQPTMELLASEIITNQTLAVNIPSESTITGQVLINAINCALEQARAE